MCLAAGDQCIYRYKLVEATSTILQVLPVKFGDLSDVTGGAAAGARAAAAVVLACLGVALLFLA